MATIDGKDNLSSLHSETERKAWSVECSPSLHKLICFVLYAGQKTKERDANCLLPGDESLCFACHLEIKYVADGI